MITVFICKSITNILFKMVVVLLKLILFQLLPCASPLSFNFPPFRNNPPTLFVEEDAFVYDTSLRLTKSIVGEQQNQSVGRATYSQPFLLRENATGKLADFTTNFTFVIDSVGKTPYADGFAFFLAPNGSLLNTTIGLGGSLGLPVINRPNNESTNLYPFVAVEFDINTNSITSIEDPVGDHVGIDINSLKSEVTTPWNGSITTGRVNTAQIRYDSGSKNLSVVYTSVVNGSRVWRNISYIVDLNEYLQGYVIVGFSAATGAFTALHRINSWNFNSTELRDGNEFKNSTPVVPVPEPNPIVVPGTGNVVNVGLVVGLVVGGCVVLAGGLVLVWCIYWRKGKTGESSDGEDPMANDLIDEEFEKGTGPKKFSYKTLAQSTGNFDEGEKLGEGGFGGVYRGFIKDLDSYVAVKRVSSGSKQGMKEYAAEVRIISRLRHRNLVQLIGWCHEKGELLLVYEFMSNGSLDSHLFKPRTMLHWEARYRIAQGLASGLFYLHEEWEQCVLHRDIKSSNIMLDSNFNAKLGDFGLARLVDHGKQSQTTVLAGTMGYMAPECLTTGKASKETDVYSFGVVALEIACGRKPIDPKFGRTQINMVEWVWELYGEGKIIEAADPKLCGEFDAKQMECLLIVGLWCAHPDYTMRPSIQQTIQVLNFEVPLPILPSKMPVASYLSLPVSFSISSSYNTDLERRQTESSGTNSSQFTSSSASNSSPSASLLYTR
ncbi:L-type lectin-domain containing receptor kinase IX.1-like isoform X2 [Malus sylvestris]|uniref:L-type lectin-domain containing receptor kinase IX.1-like isoform X2 n=1 Tax=Malus sylvestris TaxID=3752 RepID=UPI0021AB9D18|nr:L-type lectin-domain containing receptor kinase IX.1-like isoform X2 [Malus sylvestris]